MCNIIQAIRTDRTTSIGVGLLHESVGTCRIYLPENIHHNLGFVHLLFSHRCSSNVFIVFCAFLRCDFCFKSVINKSPVFTKKHLLFCEFVSIVLQTDHY